jgi:hypothetical protein
MEKLIYKVSWCIYTHTVCLLSVSVRGDHYLAFLCDDQWLCNLLGIIKARFLFLSCYLLSAQIDRSGIYLLASRDWSFSTIWMRQHHRLHEAGIHTLLTRHPSNTLRATTSFFTLSSIASLLDAFTFYN